MEILKVENLCKTYGKGEAKVNALKNVSFSLEKGEFAAVVGESGSGKSTLLNCIGALDTPTSGSIFIDGQNLFSMKEEKRTIYRRRNIGFIFQSFQLVSELNVEQNIIFPLLLDCQKPDPKKVNEILNLLGLAERRYHLPRQLSGGQQQRVAIGRALITQPKLILADEPTGSVTLVQHYPKIIPVMLLSRSTRISDMTERQSVRFSSRVRESYMLLKSVCNILSTAEKSGGVSSGASSGICCRAAVYIW